MSLVRKINKNFFKKWSNDMAYVLGFIAADGNMVKNRRGGHFLSFYSVDGDLLLSIKKIMKSGHKLSRRKYPSGEVYRFQIGSKEMFNDLLVLGFSPGKTKRLKLPNIPHKFFHDFVRGYFDGDGNVWAGHINKNRTTPTSVLQVAFTSGCEEFLKDLLSILRKKGIRGGSIFQLKNKNYSRISFSTLDSVKLYEIMYNMPHNLHLERKKLVFDKFIKMRA